MKRSLVIRENEYQNTGELKKKMGCGLTLLAFYETFIKSTIFLVAKNMGNERFSEVICCHVTFQGFFF